MNSFNSGVAFVRPRGKAKFGTDDIILSRQKAVEKRLKTNF